MAVVIEVLGWAGKSRQQFRVESNLINIGRSYENDVVLADPHISPQHLRLHATDQGWTIEDLDSLNGVQVVCKQGDIENVFASGSEIKIGRTRLRIVATDHVVEQTKLLHRLELESSRLNQLAIWLPLFIAVIITETAALYANTAVEWEWKNALPMLLSAQIVILVGALFWALVGRLIRHESHLLGQYSLLLLATLLFSAGDWLLLILNYNFNLAIFSDPMQRLLPLLIVFILFSANLALATNLSARSRWLGSGCFAGLLASISLVVEMQRWGEFSPLPDYSSTLQPPALLLVSGGSADEFLSKTDELFAISTMSIE